MRLRKHYPLIALCLGFFMVIMDVSVVNVALPKIASGLHADLSSLQWVVAGYTLTFCCFLMLAGHLSDQLGAKKTLFVGLILFSVASFACGLATQILWLIIFRLIQGVAAAALVPASLALINGSYQNHQQRAKAIGIWSAVGGIAAASGPVLSGILTATLGWPAIFFINIPIGVIASLLVWRYVREAAIDRQQTRFDHWGQIFGLIMIASIALIFIEVGRMGWGSPLVIIAVITFIISTILFLITEKKTQHPMLPLNFFKNKNFSIAIVSGILLSMGLYGELFCLPLYFHQIRGYDMLMTGFAVFPLVALVAISSFLAGKVVSRKGARLPIMIGFIMATFGVLGLLITSIHGPNYYWLILPLAMIGAGVSFAIPAVTFVVVHSLSGNRSGIASGIFTAGRQLGGLIGVAIFGSIIAAATHFVTGLHITLIISSLLFFCGALFTSFIRVEAR